MAVLFIDLDDFKTVNDAVGHVAGDEVLVGTSRRITSCLCTGDTCAHLGGEEFGVLLEGLRDPGNAYDLALYQAERRGKMGPTAHSTSR